MHKLCAITIFRLCVIHKKLIVSNFADFKCVGLDYLNVLDLFRCVLGGRYGTRINRVSELCIGIIGLNAAIHLPVCLNSVLFIRATSTGNRRKQNCKYH